MNGEKIINEVARRARLFAEDNLLEPTDRDFLMIQNAMLVGASIAMESATEEEHADTQRLLSSEDPLPFFG